MRVKVAVQLFFLGKKEQNILEWNADASGISHFSSFGVGECSFHLIKYRMHLS